MKSINRGINISSRSVDLLGKQLSNPNWHTPNLLDVETVYKRNASKITAPDLNEEDALKYDMNLMWRLQVKKFIQNPELLDEINKKGGLDFLKKCSHIIGVRNSRWEGYGEESNFIRVLIQSYLTASKKLNKILVV